MNHKWMKHIAVGAGLAGGLCCSSLFADETPAYKNAELPIEKRVQDLLGRMTLEEKVDFVTGNKIPEKGVIGSVGIPRLGLPNFKIEHGPYAFKGWYGPNQPKEIGTYFPVSISQAASWDRDLVQRVNAEMGREMKSSGGHANAGPAMCIIRDPRGGRSFEYYTEDPYLNGQIAAAHTRGVQSEGIMANLKHFACNNQEWNRHRLNVTVDERTLREIYLAGFKTAIQEGGAWSVMGAYNKINGTYSCENPFLLTKVLREDWGFNGFVLSDWAGTHSTAPSANAGLDLEMPNESWYGKKLMKSIKTGEVTEETLNSMVGNLLRGMIWAGALDGEPPRDKSVLHNEKAIAAAREAAAKGMVLLKNDKNVLPFDRAKIKKIAVIGPNGNYGPHYNDGEYNTHLLQGGGSAYIDVNQNRLITAFQGMKANAGEGIEVVYAPGCYAESGCGMIPAKYLKTPDEKSEGLLAEYYNNDRFNGEPAKIEIDKNISHMWRAEIPIPEAGRSNDDNVRFSVIWNGNLVAPETRTYTFSVRNYAGNAELFINGKLLCSNKGGSWLNFNDMATIDLKAGESYDIKVKYAKISGRADFRLGWDYENAQWMKEAVALAEDADAVLMTVGLSGHMGEREAGDRNHLRLFPAQEELINTIAKVNPNTAVSIIAGSAIDMRNWMGSASSILMAWYPGEQGGNGLADVVFGDVNPSARLPITFPQSLKQYPEDFHCMGTEIEYKEGIFVGYRYFDKHNLKPLFPFGYGLSYTEFSYGEPAVEADGVNVSVRLDITNTGKCRGAEVVQLYVKDVECSVPRPPKELKGFEKVWLGPGETKTVSFELDDRAFSFFDEASGDWTVEPGEFELLIGSSSRDIRSQARVSLKQQL
jgi:beta-glucosidase